MSSEQENSNKCVVCNNSVVVRLRVLQQGHIYYVSCVRCGEYQIEHHANDALAVAIGLSPHEIKEYAKWSDTEARPLTHKVCREIARKAKLKGMNEPRSALSYTLRAKVNTNNPIDLDLLVKILESMSLPSPAEQGDNLILFLGDNLDSPGSFLEISSVLELGGKLGLKIGKESYDLDFIIESLVEQGLLRLKMPDTLQESHKIVVSLTMAGWQRREELKKQHVESQMAFMAMKFDNDVFRVVNEYFKPAVLETGFELRTLIDGQTAGLIDDQLRVALRRAKFVIADLTHGNNGAYWEAGFAEGLGRPVIYTCRKEEWIKNQTHFDTNHLVTIIWEPENLEDAAKRLINTIRATLPDAK